MTPRHISTVGHGGIRQRLAEKLASPLAYLREAFSDDEDARLRGWTREQRKRTCEGRRQ